MTSYKRLAFSAALFLLLSLPMFGTTTFGGGYTYTSSIAPINVLNSTYSPYTYNCVSSNCLVDTYDGTNTFVQFSADSDGYIWAVTSSGDEYYFSSPSAGYVKWSNSLANTARVYIASGSIVSMTTASGGNLYYWNGSNTLLGTKHCVDAAVDDQENMYCLGSDADVYQWTGSAWSAVYSNGDAETISAANGVLAIVNSTSKVYLYANGSLSSALTITAFTPSTSVGSISLGFDGSIEMMDSSTAVWVSEDSGNTWSNIDLGTTNPIQISTGGAGLHMVLGSAGHIRHVNSMLNQTNVTVTGSCAVSSCSSNPTVTFQLYTFAPNATSTSFIGGTGTTGDWTCGTWGSGNGPFCQTSATAPAHNSINYFVSAVSTTCDPYVNSLSNAQCQTTLHAQATIPAVLLAETENCDCAAKQDWYNQKYVITSSTTGRPSQSKWFGSVTSTYYWKNVSMSQWCVGLTNKQPDLSLFPAAVTIEYQHVGTAPTAMPGAYINGDVRAWQTRDSVAQLISFLIYAFTGQVMIYNSSSGYGPTTFTTNGGIYTWDGTTAKRGSGGNPTTVCQGY